MVAFTAIAAGLLPIVGSILKATILKDKPNAQKATDLALDLAMRGAMGVDRFNAFSQKVISLPPGQDFTNEELAEYRAASEAVSDRMDEVYEGLPDED